MKELGITKGEWKYRDHFSDGIVETEETIIGHLMKWGSPEDELQHNAALICNAGNTAQKCGLQPSELLKQRDELREVLKRFTERMRRYWADTYQEEAPDLSLVIEAEAAIKNTEG